MSTQRAVPEGRHQPHPLHEVIQQRPRAPRRPDARHGAGVSYRPDAPVDKATGGTAACAF
ncbi:hypothetical protein ACWCWD_22950 [Streptomyces sp. NPDC001493]